eukprot:6350129-Alexandrium_andersonii.AAC.1
MLSWALRTGSLLTSPSVAVISTHSQAASRPTRVPCAGSASSAVNACSSGAQPAGSSHVSCSTFTLVTAIE